MQGRIVMITGGRGQVATRLMEEFLACPNTHVHLFTRSPEQLRKILGIEAGSPYLSVGPTPQDMASQEQWKSSISRACEEGYKTFDDDRDKTASPSPNAVARALSPGAEQEDVAKPVARRLLPELEAALESQGPIGEIQFINTIGSSVAESGKTLFETNADPVITSAKACKAVAEALNLGARYGHVSSISPSILRDSLENHADPMLDYPRAKDELDQWLTQFDMPSIILRPGLVFGPMKRLEGMTRYALVDNEHPHSPEQHATLPIVPVLGTGEQWQQPVSLDDLVGAMYNYMSEDKYKNSSLIVDAVGPDVMTMNDISAFYKQARKEPLFTVTIGPELARAIANHCPYGRVAPYAIRMFEELDKQNLRLSPDSFQELVGKDLISMKVQHSEEAAQAMGASKVVMPPLPIIKHVELVMQTMMRSEEARRDILQAVAKEGIGMLGDITSTLMQNPEARKMVQQVMFPGYCDVSDAIEKQAKGAIRTVTSQIENKVESWQGKVALAPETDKSRG